MAQEQEAYILNKDDYEKLKSAQKSVESLKTQILCLKKQNEAQRKLKEILCRKIMKKNADLKTEQIRSIHLKQLISQMGSFVDSDAKIMKPMSISQSHYSVIRSPEPQQSKESAIENEIDDKLPQNYDLNEIYQKLQTELYEETSLVEKVVDTFLDRKKHIEFLEKKLQEKQKQNDMNQVTLNKQTEAKIAQLTEDSKKLEKKLIEVQRHLAAEKLSREESEGRYKQYKEEVFKLKEELEGQRKKMEAGLVKKPSSSSSSTSDIKDKLFHLIGEYSLYLKNSYIELELEKKDRNILLESELEDIASRIRAELKHI